MKNCLKHDLNHCISPTKGQKVIHDSNLTRDSSIHYRKEVCLIYDRPHNKVGTRRHVCGCPKVMPPIPWADGRLGPIPHAMLASLSLPAVRAASERWPPPQHTDKYPPCRPPSTWPRYPPAAGTRSRRPRRCKKTSPLSAAIPPRRSEAAARFLSLSFLLLLRNRT